MVGAALGLGVICNWQGIWVEFLLGVGVAIVLGSLGIIGAGALVRTVQLEVNRVIENAETQTAALEEKIESQARRIDTLADDVANGRTRRHAEEDAALAAITDAMSYGAVSSAIQGADHRGIISTALQEFRPRRVWMVSMHGHPKHSPYGSRRRGQPTVIALPLRFPDNRDVPGDWWLPEEDVTSVIRPRKRAKD